MPIVQVVWIFIVTKDHLYFGTTILEYQNTSIVHDTGIIKNVPVLYSSIVPVLLYKIISIVYNCYWEKGKLKKWIVKLIFIKTNNASDGIYCIH